MTDASTNQHVISLSNQSQYNGNINHISITADS